MLLFAMLALLSRSPQEIIADIRVRQDAFKQCLTEKTVELGKGNSESAETVLRAVASVCLPVEKALLDVYAESPLPAAHVGTLMKRDRKLGEDAGVAALLAARATK